MFFSFYASLFHNLLVSCLINQLPAQEGFIYLQLISFAFKQNEIGKEAPARQFSSNWI